MKGEGMIYKDHLSAVGSSYRWNAAFGGQTGCQLSQMSTIAAHFYWMSRVRNTLVARGSLKTHRAELALHCGQCSVIHLLLSTLTDI